MNKTSFQLHADIENQREILSRKETLLSLAPIDLIQEAFPEGIFIWSIGQCQLQIELPMRFSLIEEVREFFKNQTPNWSVCSDHQYIADAGYAVHYIEYILSKEQRMYVQFEFRSTQVGSTCVINKIGEQKKIIPVWEVVCSQAAADEFSTNE